jgi:serine protease
VRSNLNRITFLHYLTICCLLTLANGVSFAQPLAFQPNTYVWSQINSAVFRQAHSPNTKIKVAIVDGAIDIDHPNLKKFIGENTGEIPFNNIDDDNNGLVDDVYGWDFADGDNNVRPPGKSYQQALHGTRVTDIFVQSTNQLIPDAKKYISILPLKAHSDEKQNNYVTAGYQAIAYAIAQHADVIVCSWAGTMVTEEEKNILLAADNAGIVIVAAAGNYYFHQDQYPGAYDPVICVSALNGRNKKQKFADYGQFVDVSAPGDSIATISGRGSALDHYASGTSMAVPIIAALVTAIKATGYKGTPEDIDRLLKNSATPIDTQNMQIAGKMGAGIPDAGRISDLMLGRDTARIRLQPCGYMTLAGLSRSEPIHILAAARYTNYRLSIKPASQTYKGPPLRFKYFRDGIMHERTFDKKELVRTVTLEADSIQVYATASMSRQKQYLYYQAQTIDSSSYYCSGIRLLTDTAGVIEDGSGTANYTGRNDCKWLIQIPEGKRIKFEFTEFDIEPKNDQVYIFNGTGTEAPILAIFSGDKIPPVIRSGGHQALIWFVTNETIQARGWKLKYSAFSD